MKDMDRLIAVLAFIVACGMMAAAMLWGNWERSIAWWGFAICARMVAWEGSPQGAHRRTRGAPPTYRPPPPPAPPPKRHP